MISGHTDSSPPSKPGHASRPSQYISKSPLDVEPAGSMEDDAHESWHDEDAGAIMDASSQTDTGEAPRTLSSSLEDAEEQETDGITTRSSSGFLLRPLRVSHNIKRSKRDPDGPSSTHTDRSGKLEAEASGVYSRDGTPELNTDGVINPATTPTNGNTPEGIHIRRRRKLKGKAKASDSPSTSQRSSTLAESSNSTSAAIEDGSPQVDANASAAKAPIVDPSAIVRMALSLNESRRLNLSPGRLASNPSPVGRRTTSARLDLPSTSLQGHFGDHRQSLRRSIQSRSPSRTVSPNLDTSGGQQSRPPSSKWPAPQPSGLPEGVIFDQDVGYGFSSGTNSRAQKARDFFELHHEYRRLLQVLPPLAPTTTSTHSRKMSRPYNPLQYIRNRKIRGRERGLLDPEGAGWNEITDVKSWVDSTETEAKLPGFRSGDIAMLPPWNRTAQRIPEAPPESSQAEIPGNVTAGSKPKRPKLEWTFSPADLLADAYWLEQDSHKTLIESRDGNKIFHRFQRPENLGAPEASRLSYESKIDTHDGFMDSAEPEMKWSPTSPPSGEINAGADLEHRARNTTPNESNMARVKRRLLPRRRTGSVDASASSGTDDEEVVVAREGKTSLGRRLGVNIGPLEKHMNTMLKSEASQNGRAEVLDPKMQDGDDVPQRRGGVSSEYYEQVSSPMTPDRRPSNPRGFDSLRSSFSTDRADSPRISVDDVDGGRTWVNGYPVSPSERLSPNYVTGKRMKKRPLDFLHRRGKSKLQNNIAENDFAVLENESSRDLQLSPAGSPRSSVDSSLRLHIRRHLAKREGSARVSDGNKVENVEFNPDREAGKSSAARFFKGGRIGDIVHGARKDSDPSTNSGVGATDSDSDAYDHLKLQASNNEPRRIQSANDLRHLPSYHIKDLPTFRSTNAHDTAEEERKPANLEDDHIYRQLREQRDQERARKSRNGKLAPLSLDTSTDVSPNTSSYDLTQLNTSNTSQTNNTSNSHSSAGVHTADQRLQRVLREPGGVGRGGLPITGLSKIDAKPSKGSRLVESQGARSSSDGFDMAEDNLESAVTARDISHVRSLLLSSGIKGQAIVRRAHEVRDPPSEHVAKAAKIADVAVSPVSRKQEHILAARILSNYLENAASSFGNEADGFRNDTCHKLQAQIDDLRERVNSDLTPHIRSCSDDADAFIARLTTSNTLAVKQVSDSVDLMMRSRWRRVRWLRRVGFKMLELLLVGLMWWIWLFVCVFKVARGLFVGVGSGIKWLLWI